MENLLGIGINVTFSGVVIVFSMLVLLVLILILFGKVGQLLKNEKPATETKRTLVKVSETPATSVNTASVSTEPSPEIIAVIAAAVAAMYSDSKVKPIIKSVKRAGVRPAWAVAGIVENTRPF